MNVGFLGAGNMASAIISGMTQSGFDKKKIFFTRKNTAALQEYAEKFGINSCENAEKLAEKVQIIIISVKPNQVKSEIEKIRDKLQANNIILISIAAGISTENLAEWSYKGVPAVRIMPNVNAAIGKSVSAFFATESVPGTAKDYVHGIFKSIGEVFLIEEGLFSAFSAIAGCAPAFTYLFADMLATGGMKNGLPKNQALEIVYKMLEGSALMMQKSGEHPGQLIDKVCSPGGTTIAGIAALHEHGFPNAVIKAVDATLIREKEILK